MQLDPEALRGAGKVSSFGLVVGVSMLAFGMAGVWIDGRLGTSPIVTVILFLLGGGGGLAYGIIRILK